MSKNYAEKFDSLKDLFKAYRETGRCLASFNVNDNYDARAVIEAARITSYNVCYTKLLRFVQLPYLSPVTK